jgi:hypothetical protein
MYEQVINSRNTTGTSLLTVEETCTYSPHPTNAGWTRYTQDARIQSAVPLLNRKFESYSVENMESKSPKVHYNTYHKLFSLLASTQPKRIPASGFEPLHPSGMGFFRAPRF